jgi:hypothetical protein
MEGRVQSIKIGADVGNDVVNSAKTQQPSTSPSPSSSSSEDGAGEREVLLGSYKDVHRSAYPPLSTLEKLAYGFGDICTHLLLLSLAVKLVMLWFISEMIAEQIDNGSELLHRCVVQHNRETSQTKPSNFQWRKFLKMTRILRSAAAGERDLWVLLASLPPRGGRDRCLCCAYSNYRVPSN